MCESIHDFLKKIKTTPREKRSVVAGGFSRDSMTELFGVMELFCALIVVVITRVYTCAKIQRSGQEKKKVNFIV